MIFEEFETVRIAGTLAHSSVNGPGVRYVIFFQGCPHHCRECQNPETWDPLGGAEVPVEQVITELKGTRYLDGVTLSGGDPLLQPVAAARIAAAAKELHLSVWCYTGWTFEALMRGAAGESALQALEQMDVLVDGAFRIEERTEQALYRGSANQRLIDLPASLPEKIVHVVSQIY